MPSLASVLEHRGCPIHYRVRGEGSPVVLIQGVGVHGDGWLPQVEDLSSDFRCLTFDNRGMGKSQPAALPISVEQMAEDTLALMDKQGWNQAHLVGHSLGGLVAQHLALSARARVRSLSLLCTFARGRDATSLTPWMLWVGMRTRIGTLRSRRRAFLQMVMPPSALAQCDRDAVAASMEPLFGHDLGDQPPIVMKQLSAMQAYDATPRLGELDGLSTLVVSAEHDRIAPPRSGQAIAKGIPGAVYVELPDASHGVTIHQPDRINSLLRQHFTYADRQ